MGVGVRGLHLVARDDVEEFGCVVDEILTVTDRATKMVVLIPCSSRCNAAEVADNFWWEVVHYHGLPRSIISNRGRYFIAILE